MLIYDCEILKAIPSNKEPKIEGIEYCEGWRDFTGMGIACIAAYDSLTKNFRVFCKDNFSEFQKLVIDRNPIVGFNSLAFDNPLCEANGIHIPREKSCDILVKIWKAAGLSEIFNYPSHLGYGLADMCRVNFGVGKSGNGALAPVLWQRGQIGEVIDYCIRDVWLTLMLVKKINTFGFLINPKDREDSLLFSEQSIQELR